MKPRTRIQQEVARLSKRLPRLTEEQRVYAFRHCFKHYAVKGKRHEHLHRVRTFVEKRPRPCGYRLRMHLPRCGMELEALRTRKSVFRDMEYFSIVTTCKQSKWYAVFSVKSSDTRRGNRSFHLLRCTEGGLPPTAGQQPLPDCVACLYSTMTCGMNTATWRCARAPLRAYDITRDAQPPDSVSYPK